MLDSVKKALRVSSSHFDDEIQVLIESARLDLIQSGVSSLYDVKVDDIDDFLIEQTIVYYCKANFGYDNPDADRYMRAYKSNRNKLSYASDYNA